MRLVTYSHETEIKLGVQLDEWILDLQRARDYLLRGVCILDGEVISNDLIPESMIELINIDSPYKAEARQTLMSIRESLPNALGSLISKAILLESEKLFDCNL